LKKATGSYAKIRKVSDKKLAKLNVKRAFILVYCELDIASSNPSTSRILATLKYWNDTRKLEPTIGNTFTLNGLN